MASGRILRLAFDNALYSCNHGKPYDGNWLEKIRNVLSLFRNKRFTLDEMTQQNASKFAILLEYEDPNSFFHFSFCATFFPPN